MIKTMVLMLGLMLIPAAAWADQCQVVTDAQAAAAVARLSVGRVVLRYCEPCGEQLNSHAPEVVRSAVVVPDGNGTNRVMLNGEEIDLAYVFVRDRNGNLVNLARLSGCPTQGVSPTIALPPPPVAAEAPPTVTGGGGVAITSCVLRNTGFLGMGAGREADVGVINRTGAARAFTVRVFVLYPGGGRELAAESAIATAPGVPATSRIRFRARPGMTNVQCEVDQ